jgi:hypothetical protein
MSRRSELTIVFVLIINIACGVSRAAAQSDTYPRMAAIDQYLMEKNAEIQLARSAAPDSISRDATVLSSWTTGLRDRGRRQERVCLYGGKRLDGNV